VWFYTYDLPDTFIPPCIHFQLAIFKMLFFVFFSPSPLSIIGHPAIIVLYFPYSIRYNPIASASRPPLSVSQLVPQPQSTIFFPMKPPRATKVTKCKVRVRIFLWPLAFKLGFFSLGGFKYYHPETGDPDPRACPRSSKVCWFVHPNEPEWNEIGGGGRMSSSSSPLPRRHGKGRRSRSPRKRGGSRSGSRSRSRTRSRSRDGRGRSRSRTKSGGRYVSPSRRRPRLSSPPPRRPLYERIQRSNSPHPRSRSRRRSYSPRNRRPPDRRPRPRTPTPISSSRGHTPPKRSSPRTVKAEPPTESVPNVPPKPVDSAAPNMNASAVSDQPSITPRVTTDRSHHQERPPSLNLSLGQHATSTATSPQPPLPPPRVGLLSSVFVPETPVIPGLSAPVQLSQPQVAVISALQKSLEQVMRDRAANPTVMQSPYILPPVNSTTPIPAAVSEVEKTEIWTSRVKCVELASFIIRFTDAFFDKPCVGYGLI